MGKGEKEGKRGRQEKRGRVEGGTKKRREERDKESRKTEGTE